MWVVSFATARRCFEPLIRPIWSVKRAMSNDTHLERTADKPRGRVFSRAVVTEILQLSPSVTGFTLKVANPDLKFIAGQWVDVHIPGIDVVGGYSIISPPHQLADPSTRTVELAVKRSPHPPTEWMTTKCIVGDEVNIQVGGDFCYSPSSGKGLSDLILVGGGVGINPLLSMLLHHVTVMVDHAPNDRGSVHLLYSSKTEHELLFKDKLKKIASANGNIHVRFFTTSEAAGVAGAITEGRRVCESDLLAVLSKIMKRNTIQAYICGPPPMTDTMVEVLTNNKQCSLSTEQIHFERWW